MARTETLLGPTTVLLFGKRLRDLKLQWQEPNSSHRPPRAGANNFLQQQLAAPDACFARIYGFSYEGHYYDLSKPGIFLVHGDGTEVEGPLPGDERPPSRYSRSTPSTDRIGVPGQSAAFSDEIRVWAYDKGDFGMRLDPDTGPIEQILLDAELGAESSAAHYSGAKVSGAKVSGAKVRGAKFGLGRNSGRED